MGGYGSGRRWFDKKDTVEDCRSIDACHWQREGVLKVEVWQRGSWVWTDPRTQKERASIGYEVKTVMPIAWVRLQYDVTARATGTPKSYDYRIQLVTTRPSYGGRRWWFICPLVVNGRTCGRRVRKLYLAPGCNYFGCRHCLNLTYTSAQEHDKRVDFFRKHPELISAMLDSGSVANPNLLLALRAMRRW